MLCAAKDRPGYKKCVTSDFVCDDDWDCDDGSDEKNCVHDTDEHCYGDRFECENKKQCIDVALKCDGKEDCSDGSDEPMDGSCGKQ